MTALALRLVVGVLLAIAFGGGAQAGEKQDDIRDLMEITGSASMLDQMIALMIPQIIDVIRAANKEIPEELLREFERLGIEEFRNSKSEFFESVELIYDANFTHDDIHDMLAFYATPTGRKLIAAMPTILQQSQAAGQIWGRSIGERIARKLVEEARSRGYDL